MLQRCVPNPWRRNAGSLRESNLAVNMSIAPNANPNPEHLKTPVAYIIEPSIDLDHVDLRNRTCTIKLCLDALDGVINGRAVATSTTKLTSNPPHLQRDSKFASCCYKAPMGLAKGLAKYHQRAGNMLSQNVDRHTYIFHIHNVHRYTYFCIEA